jgi:hypothetical protein
MISLFTGEAVMERAFGAQKSLNPRALQAESHPRRALPGDSKKETSPRTQMLRRQDLPLQGRGQECSLTRAGHSGGGYGTGLSRAVPLQPAYRLQDHLRAFWEQKQVPRMHLIL